MAAFLARAGLSVAMAHDGATGLAQARRYLLRVALLDYNLPDMTGVQLAEKLRAAFPEMAILIASGPYRSPSGADAEGARHLAFLANKPLPLVLLRQAVLRLARGRGQLYRAAAARRRLAGGRLRRHAALTVRDLLSRVARGERPWLLPASPACWPAA